MTSTATPQYSLEFANGLIDQSNAADRIDRTNKIIKGVKVLGLDSKNPAYVLGVQESDYDPNGARFGEAANKPYSYEMEGVRKAIGLYENAKIFLDHTNFQVDQDTGKRVLSGGDNKRHDDLLGWLVNVRAVEGEGLYADLHYLESHPFAARLLEIAERNPSIIGLSHEALLEEPKLTGNKVTIPGIKHVQRVALISEQPGTTAGLFESAISPRVRKVKKKTIRQILANAKPEMEGYESLNALIALIDKKEKPKVGIIAEMGDDDYSGLMGGIGDAPMGSEDGIDDPKEDSDPADDIKDALIKSICQMIEQANSGQIKKVLQALGIVDSMSETIGGPAEDSLADKIDEGKDKTPPPLDITADESLKKDPDAKQVSSESDDEPIDPDKDKDDDVTKEHKIVDNSAAIFECMATLSTEGASEFASNPVFIKAMISLTAEDRVNYAKALVRKTPEKEPYVPKPRSASVPGPVVTTVAENQIDFTKEGALAEFWTS